MTRGPGGTTVQNWRAFGGFCEFPKDLHVFAGDLDVATTDLGVPATDLPGAASDLGADVRDLLGDATDPGSRADERCRYASDPELSRGDHRPVTANVGHLCG